MLGLGVVKSYAAGSCLSLASGDKGSASLEAKHSITLHIRILISLL